MPCASSSVNPRQYAIALALLQGRWSIRLLATLAEGPLRYSDLMSALPGVSPTVLNARLPRLADSGLVSHGHARSLYELTRTGMSLGRALRPLCERAPADAIAVIEHRWALPILLLLGDGPARFSEIERAFPAMAPDTLSARLRELGDSGLVERHVEPGPPVSTLYSLTKEGERLRPALARIRRWADDSRRRQGF
ncbi:MAG: helix-turn-helix transcriptional regulator [Acidimicrobiia bacterium]|nr:helix-turn-helix transcriptional regulator [Acidimicrobiia bacterium]